MYTIRNKVLFEYLEVVTVVAEITEAGAESEDLNMQVIENDKRLAALSLRYDSLSLNPKLELSYYIHQWIA